MQTSFRRWSTLSVLVLGAAIHGQNAKADPGDVIRWQSVTGIVQPNNVVGTGTGAATGGPSPWSALDGHVSVDLDRGRVDFNVRGLVLAAGNSIGTPGPVAQVKGTLVCDTDGSAGGNSVLVDTPLVELNDQGNAQFKGIVGYLPAVCLTEPDIAFLIRVGTGRWIANGVVLR